MDGAIVQQKIQYGYAKCATKIGAPFLIYRSKNPINPIVTNNIIGVLPCSANSSWEYMTTQKFGKVIWNMIIDTQLNSPVHAQVGDYLVPTPGFFSDNSGLNDYQNLAYNQAGALSTDVQGFYSGFTEDINMYYIAATQFLQPIMGVQTNRVINIIRPTQTIGAGYQGYAEYLPATSTTIMSGMPASILESGNAGGADTKLPTDSKDPRWSILIPNLGNVIVRVDDIIIDDLNQEYVVTDNELTVLGWRILAEQVVNSR